MVSKRLSLLFLSLLLVPAAVGQKEAPQQNPPGKGAKAVAAAAKTAPKVELTLVASGLTAENQVDAKTALSDLTTKEYKCPGCGEVKDRAGTCEACDMDLEARTRPIFKDVRTAADKGTIVCHLAPFSNVRFSTIESALRPVDVKIEREKLELRAPIFVYAGGTSKDDATQLQKVFRDGKFASAEATFDAASKEIHLRLPEAAPNWQAAAQLGSGLAKPLRLSDVMWSTMPVSRAS